MHRMTSLLIATRNTNKLGEIRSILGDQFQYLTLRDFPEAPEVVEDADTFAANATKKAVGLARWLASRNSGLRIQDRGLLILADDSGLEVDALNGAPGVHSARFAAPDTAAIGNSTDVENNTKLLRQLQAVPLERRTARFRCVLALTPFIDHKTENASPVCYADEFEMHTVLFEGACEGQILLTARGKDGFGYDPLFVPDGFEQSFAELGEDVKSRISHRSRALGRLREYRIASGGFSV